MNKIFTMLILSVLICNCSTQKLNVKNDNEYIVTAKKGINLRKTPDRKGEFLAIVPLDEQLNVLKSTDTIDNIDGISSPWYLVKYKTDEGWVFGGYLKKIHEYKKDNASRVIKKTSGDLPVYGITTGKEILFRRSPYGITMKDLKEGEVVFIIKKENFNKKKGKEDFWYQVKNINGITGWLKDDCVYTLDPDKIPDKYYIQLIPHETDKDTDTTWYGIKFEFLKDQNLIIFRSCDTDTYSGRIVMRLVEVKDEKTMHVSYCHQYDSEVLVKDNYIFVFGSDEIDVYNRNIKDRINGYKLLKGVSLPQGDSIIFKESVLNFDKTDNCYYLKLKTHNYMTKQNREDTYRFDGEKFVKIGLYDKSGLIKGRQVRLLLAPGEAAVKELNDGELVYFGKKEKRVNSAGVEENWCQVTTLNRKTGWISETNFYLLDASQSPQCFFLQVLKDDAISEFFNGTLLDSIKIEYRKENGLIILRNTSKEYRGSRDLFRLYEIKDGKAVNRLPDVNTARSFLYIDGPYIIIIEGTVDIYRMDKYNNDGEFLRLAGLENQNQRDRYMVLDNNSPVIIKEGNSYNIKIKFNNVLRDTNSLDVYKFDGEILTKLK